MEKKNFNNLKFLFVDKLTLDHIILLERLKIRNPHESVFKGKIKQTGNELIIKRFNRMNESAFLGFLREKNVNFQHKNINRLCLAECNENECFIAREFLRGADLQHFKFNFFINHRQKINFYIQAFVGLLDGLYILHNNNVIHRDIRPANIFIKYSDKKQAIKNPHTVLIDFGLAKVPQLAEIDKISPFAFYYSAPEQVLKINELVDETSDIYAAGISLWTLITGKMPFYHKIPEVLANLQITYPLQKHRKIPENLWKIIQKATKKPVFKKSFKNYSRNELIEMLQQAKNQRYQSAQEMKNEMLNLNMK